VPSPRRWLNRRYSPVPHDSSSVSCTVCNVITVVTHRSSAYDHGPFVDDGIGAHGAVQPQFHVSPTRKHRHTDRAPKPPQPLIHSTRSAPTTDTVALGYRATKHTAASDDILQSRRSLPIRRPERRRSKRGRQGWSRHFSVGGRRIKKPRINTTATNQKTRYGRDYFFRDATVMDDGASTGPKTILRYFPNASATITLTVSVTYVGLTQINALWP